MVPYRSKSYFQTEISFRKRSIYTQINVNRFSADKTWIVFFSNTTIIEYDCISEYFGKCQHFVSNTTIIEYDCISEYFGKCQHFVSNNTIIEYDCISTLFQILTVLFIGSSLRFILIFRKNSVAWKCIKIKKGSYQNNSILHIFLKQVWYLKNIYICM